MKKHFPLLMTVTAMAAAFTLIPARAADVQYKLLKEIPVGGEGGWDYLSVDESARRLYVSHATKVVVIDIDKNTVVGEITNTPGIHGVALAPKLNRGFTSNGRENKAGIVDLKTLATLSHVDTQQNPDGMLYEPGREEVYMFNGRSQSVTIFGAKSGEVVTNLPLDGKPEFPQADPKLGRVFDNLEDKSEVAVIDTKTHTVVTNWPIAPGEEASGMAIDVKSQRIFLGCGNKMMVMMDYIGGKVVGSVPIGSGVDANAFDPGTKLAFASCGDGTTTIAHEDSPEGLTVVQTLQTTRGARTITLDPKTHNIYLGAAQYEPQAEAPAGAPRQRPRIIAGSFKILVYGMEKTSNGK